MKFDVGCRAGALGLALALGLVVGAGCWSPDDRREAAARNLYDRHCARCHGLAETGPSPATGLPYEVADLRRLHERYGTPLDRDRLAAYIDGRHLPEGERSEDMPVWGEDLYAHLPEDAALEDLRAGAIDLLIEYLQTIQSPSGDAGPAGSLERDAPGAARSARRPGASPSG